MKITFEKIAPLMEAFQKEADLQLNKGNKAAGTRARKHALELTKLLKEFRKISVEADKK